VTSLAPASVSCTASTDATIHSTGIYIATTDDPLVESSFKIKIATKTSRHHRVRIEFEVEIHRLPFDFTHRVRIHIDIVAHTLAVVVFYFLLQLNRFRTGGVS